MKQTGHILSATCSPYRLISTTAFSWLPGGHWENLKHRRYQCCVCRISAKPDKSSDSGQICSKKNAKRCSLGGGWEDRDFSNRECKKIKSLLPKGSTEWQTAVRFIQELCSAHTYNPITFPAHHVLKRSKLKTCLVLAVWAWSTWKNVVFKSWHWLKMYRRGAEFCCKWQRCS